MSSRKDTVFLDFIRKGYSLKKSSTIERKIILLQSGNWRILFFARNNGYLLPRVFLQAASNLIDEALGHIRSNEKDFEIQWNICVEDSDLELHDFTVTPTATIKYFPSMSCSALMDKIEDRFGEDFVKTDELEMIVKFKNN